MKSTTRILMTTAVFLFIIFITISFAFLVELEDVEYNKQALSSSSRNPPRLQAHGRIEIVSKYETQIQDKKLVITAFQHGIWHLRVIKHGPTPFQVPDDVLDHTPSPLPIAINSTPSGCHLAAVGPQVHSVLHFPCTQVGSSLASSTPFHLSSTGLERVQVQLCDPYPCVQTTFLHCDSLHGIPERAMAFALPDGSYRLFNRDIQFPLDNPQGLYGAIPFLMGHGGLQATSGVLWFNAADSTVRLSTMSAGRSRVAEWRAVGGIVDLFLFPGPTPWEVMRQMAWVSGPVVLPPLFSLGYHQCRWSYKSQQDVLAVDAGFDQHQLPYDVIWLDIDHTRGNRYFTWDRIHFPDPKGMQVQLQAKGRHLVCITDPHIKRDRDWPLFREASAGNHFILDSNRKEFEGWCWPGQSSWIDFHDPAARAWYAKQFAYDRWEASTPILHAWIDMNEPSVFNHFEGTVPANAMHHNGHPHAHQHNLYGFYQSVGAYTGLLERNARDPAEDRSQLSRPFVLTRSFFAGSQRFAAAWTGDNRATWAHLAATVPMLLSLSVAGMPFVGADVGGFFGNPTPELLVRWYQLGAVYPFFRGHSHQDSQRREPWLFGAETTAHIRVSIQLRYRLLPYLYTAFRMASLDGGAIWNPLMAVWPARSGDEDQFLVGPALMAKPVLAEGITRVGMDLPDAALWFDFHRLVPYDTPSVSVAAPLSGLVPLVQRVGTIVPLWSTVPASTGEMEDQPRAHTLQVALDSQGQAVGSIYIDDGHTFGFQAGRYLHRLLRWSEGRLACQPLGRPVDVTPALRDSLGLDSRYARPVPAEVPDPGPEVYAKAYVSRIVVLGLRVAPTSLVGTVTSHHPQAGDDPEAIRSVQLLWKEGRLSVDHLRIELWHSWTFALTG